MSHDRYTMSPEEKKIRDLEAELEFERNRNRRLDESVVAAWKQRIKDLEGQIINLKSTIEAWNHADIMKCGCKYNKVWAGTKWEHWLVPCANHQNHNI